MEDFSKFIPYQMKLVMKGLEKQGNDYLAHYNISMGQAYILVSLLEQDGSTLTRVCQRANLESSSLTTMVDRLERDQLVERKPSTQDRRITLLYITDKGKKIATRIYEEGLKHNEAIMAILGEYKDAWYQIIKRLGKFIEDGYEVSDENITRSNSK
ncbi:MAG: MarR family transcriptional regulator [Syntrophomonadaceae bacterium]|jgi:DNA-binding MarR family transcriptional regulator|nr:MarR family transcriptional regulator [Syntrophomonadaceae bacterium]MDD3271573.1 MarR family transcriptional regulator [Syntrophomonadaceae bacterium]MDD3897458.1 MarR family transcriptional regulator [Syntrophomonadaceae bacterium]